MYFVRSSRLPSLRDCDNWWAVNDGANLFVPPAIHVLLRHASLWRHGVIPFARKAVSLLQGYVNETRELHRSFYDRNSQIFSGNRLPENQVDSSTYCLAHGMRPAPHILSTLCYTLHCSVVFSLNYLCASLRYLIAVVFMLISTLLLLLLRAVTRGGGRASGRNNCAVIVPEWLVTE